MVEELTDAVAEQGWPNLSLLVCGRGEVRVSAALTKSAAEELVKLFRSEEFIDDMIETLHQIVNSDGD